MSTMNCKNASAGAVVQLLAKGSIDSVLLSGSGSSPFRASHFKIQSWAGSYEVVSCTQGSAPALNFSNTTELKFTFQRTGDLIRHLYVKFQLPGLANVNGDGLEIVDAAEVDAYGDAGAVAATADAAVPYYANGVGYQLIECATISFGSTVIDNLTTELLFALEELNGSASKKLGLERMVGLGSDEGQLRRRSRRQQNLYVPMPFYFGSEAHGTALPIVALQFHEVSLSVTVRAIRDVIVNYDLAMTRARPAGDGQDIVRIGNGTTTAADFVSIADASFHAQAEALYVYLEQEERVRFASVKHEVLIPQYQMQKINITPGTAEQHKLQFNHAVSALIMMIPKANSAEGRLDFSGHRDSFDMQTSGPITKMHLSLNNTDRTQQDKEASFFSHVVPYETCEAVPNSDVYLMSFALSPFDPVQPSGHLNMSRVDDPYLHFSTSGSSGVGNQMLVFARSWNVLRIAVGISGMTYTYNP